MSDLTFDDFASFFEAITGFEGKTWHAPFLWQRRLAQQVATTGWPDALDLPTATGKTACLEIAVFALALQSGHVARDRWAPRRILFAVDRRVVVDQAYERGERIASALAAALRDKRAHPVLRAVAARLSALAGPGSPPLGHARLRGGIPRSNAWTRLPSQPAIIACTVDQLGSRLLFRSYGANDRAAPIEAGLVGNDALVFLDEAHCARPFYETARAIQAYRAWAEHPVWLPFRLVILSATPEAAIGTGAELNVFRLTEEERNEEELRRRLQASKQTALLVASGTRVPRGADRAEERAARSRLAQEIAERALAFVRDWGKRRVAVMVNRVATAIEVRTAIRSKLETDSCDVVLMTGRMRPLDRDDLLGTWEERLRAGASPTEGESPVIVVATQSLEVGADFDFDALVTEAASLDALRQRFGRLDRLGTKGASPAIVAIAAYQEKDSESDPVYGAALAATWQWLVARAGTERPSLWTDRNLRDAGDFVDFGVEAVRAWGAEAEAPELHAPAASAPVMFPAHLDRWVQTNPASVPDPEPSFFLHGAERAAPEVNVLWRLDLKGVAGDRHRDEILEALSLCPPSALETLPVSLAWLRRWMKEEHEVPPEESDVEGRGATDESEKSTQRWVVIWRGSKRSKVTRDPRVLRPGDTVVLLDADPGSFRPLLCWDGSSHPILDLGDRAQLTARGRAVLRLHPALIDAWPSDLVSNELRSAIKEYVARLADGIERDELDELLDPLRRVLSDLTTQSELPAHARWLSRVLTALVEEDIRVALDRHPFGGVVLRGPRGQILPEAEALPPVESTGDEDETDLWSKAPAGVPLVRHLADVERIARDLGTWCALPDLLCADVATAARLHDLGKLDERFQALLRGDGLPISEELDTALAKSAEFPTSWQAQRRLARPAGLPAGFRHELLSVKLVESNPALLATAADPELVLHLIASHHGRCRPFAPVVIDNDPVEVRCTLDGHALHASSATGLERVGSGVAERFWRLVRRYGWWGLAYLETMLRISDHRASETLGEARHPPPARRIAEPAEASA